ncbi:MAG: hypothetical protein HOK21_18160 [Rhodospirillaceae bacterium]|jgi:hypothetical protein|nr:hypothetical protein [Rhodospirillaceae bacterium]MBT4690957.1 hypothetical protein [Rhodospirillaceae bacterium]MBT5079989.1 hypothetical protein [Rhodospirillaceae bacterium]MBT5526011.1 hypothetical protein [Rhodospirillaceae bacterium]MBT5881800.1 hypothetical protein [Rhodospirillaceae bacterium]
MPTDRPNVAELVEAVREFLTDHVGPNVEGQLAFHTRVAVNALAIVERTLAQGGAMDEAELLRLKELLHQDGNLEEMNAALARAIRAGEMDDQRAELLAHLRLTAADKIALANPRYLTPRG